ncbi:hypothetical protein [Polynucleobacter sp. JS-Polo-80-F4]|uniref:bestrophin-like domain n=1 Tax=Polynucleobacter sp. JS-Polo-80-F4 TaxID=2576918 RepID=UPI001C0D7268|nr:hypothetical protein [Polynucleobacter sp. JS-Polo-80-F4]MBU3617160.1 hypothetical protein [Polynucleobacter sp. JS-Polo-80-F4]
MSLFTTELLILIVAVTLITAGVAYAIYWALNDSPIARWLHDSDAVVPSFLSITSFIFGLAISTLAGYSFDHHQSAISNLITESNAIETIISTATILPKKDQIEIHSGLKNYLSAVIEKEWPAMESRDVSKREIATPEFMALNKIISDIAYQPNQRSSVENQLLSAIGTMRHDRQIRQSLAYDNDSLKKWPSIPVFSFLLLLSVGIVHLGSIKAMKVSLSIASLCIVTAVIFLFIGVSPYRGWNPVEPLKLQESLRMFDSLKTN